MKLLDRTTSLQEIEGNRGTISDTTGSSQPDPGWGISYGTDDLVSPANPRHRKKKRGGGGGGGEIEKLKKITVEYNVWALDADSNKWTIKK